MAKTVRDAMTKRPTTVAADATIVEAARAMRDEDAGIVPVVDGDRLEGVITDRDIAVRGVAKGQPPQQRSVGEVMTNEVKFIFEDEEVGEAAKKMATWQVHRLPVLDRNKQLVGIVSLGDVALETEDHGKVAEAVEGIVQPTGKREQ